MEIFLQNFQQAEIKNTWVQLITTQDTVYDGPMTNFNDNFIKIRFQQNLQMLQRVLI